jgi:asparagine synthase (glutamine-hydrolysing)
MCGIFAYLSATLGSAAPQRRQEILQFLQSYHKTLIARGPDANKVCLPMENLILHFYRLSINGLTDTGMQPFHLKEYPGIYAMCNGEIYNHAYLEAEMGHKNVTGSDCECLIPLYDKYGFETMLHTLDGVFAIAIWDDNKQQLFVGRDRYGVRPLFMCPEYWGPEGDETVIQTLQIASEMKAIYTDPTGYMASGSAIVPPGKCRGQLKTQQLVPGTYQVFQFAKTGITIVKTGCYFAGDFCQFPVLSLNDVLGGIRTTLRHAVKKRLMSDRPIGCLLSGGLDSSLIAAIVAQEMQQEGKQLHTFSVGMRESTDIKFAREAAEFIGSTHHEYILSPEEFLESINHIVYTIESWDTTTVRASVGNYLVCQKISEYNASVPWDQRVVVLFSGEGSDELAGGYLYHRKAPSGLDFHLEAQRLLKELYMFDVLRSDRCISSNGLEARVPFLDKDFISFYMTIPLMYRADRQQQEKWLLREAFRGEEILPDSVLFRSKEAFSDGVSGTTKSWWQMIHEWVDDKIPTRELTEAKAFYKDTTTTSSKEPYYFMKQFQERYPNQQGIIDHYWLPKWSGMVSNPSARCLTEYCRDAQEWED